MKWWPRKALPLGARGERAAAWRLRWKGYRILGRNVSLGRYEIDLIVRRGDTVAFVEVKTRQSAEYLEPEVNVTETKKEHLRRAARTYLDRYDDGETYYRFDVISVVMPERGRPTITHYENAFS